MPQALHDAQCFERESDRVLPEILILALAIRMAATRSAFRAAEAA